MELQEKLAKRRSVHQVFTPGTPINKANLFAGRTKEIERVLGAVWSLGQHAVIYGERGVGKSSLAGIIYDLVFMAGKEQFLPARINCAEGMDPAAIWKAVFKQLQITKDDGYTYNLSDDVPENPNPEDVRELFARLDNPAIVIIDEFDRVDPETTTAISDTIKTLSDRAVESTLIVVGVADSVDQLIEQHQSIVRALIQIQMRRMADWELMEIITKGLEKTLMTIDNEVSKRIVRLSQGLPYYTHLLAKNASLAAIDVGRTAVNGDDEKVAIKEAVNDQSQSIASSYMKAVRSSKRNIFREVLLACALATDDFGVFSPADIRAPLRMITNKNLEIPAFARHLKEFRDISRGPIIERKGEKFRYQYKFIDPLMEPYVLMKGMDDGLITDGQIESLYAS